MRNNFDIVKSEKAVKLDSRTYKGRKGVLFTSPDEDKEATHIRLLEKPYRLTHRGLTLEDKTAAVKSLYLVVTALNCLQLS